MNKLSRPLWALTGCFISLGVVGNTLFARYPALQAQFQLSAADWGWTLFALGLGGLTAYPLNRLLLLRWGSRAMIQRCGVLLGLWMVGVPWAFNTLQLWLAVYVLGVLVNAIKRRRQQSGRADGVKQRPTQHGQTARDVLLRNHVLRPAEQWSRQRLRDSDALWFDGYDPGGRVLAAC